MPYKNSDGNSPIANEWGQCRYFNSAMTKLGESKATAPTIKPQKTIEEADDWFGAVGAAFKGVQGVYEARKELAERVIANWDSYDKYLKFYNQVANYGYAFQQATKRRRGYYY